MTARTSFWLGVLLLMLAAMSWSTAGLFPRMVSTDIATTLFWRSLLGGLSVLAMLLVFDSRNKLRDLGRLTAPEWVMSFTTAMAMVTFIAAFFYASVADVVFIYGAFPVITLMLSALLLHTGVRRSDLISSVGVALGVGVIFWGQSSMRSVFGTLLSIVATLMFAFMTIGIKRYPQAQMLKVTYIGAFISALAMLPFAQFVNTSMGDVAWLWLYGVTNIGVGFGLFLLGVRRVKAVLASLICMVEIPMAPLWVYLLFDEHTPQQSLIGGAVVLVAVVSNLLWTSRRVVSLETPIKGC